MKRRLFTFGCSFTAYSWPTWATLLSASDFDEAYNWGMAGLGNRAIAEKISECNVKYNFTEHDTIIVQWSTHLRNDFFHQAGLVTDRVAGWKTAGSLFNIENQRLYDREWLLTFFDEEAFIYHTLNHIHLTQQLLENTKCAWYMTSIGDIRNLCSDFQVVDYYGEQSIFSKLASIFNKSEYPLYLKTPSLKVYNKKIWEDYSDHWLEPIFSFLQKNIKDSTKLFYTFINEETKIETTDFHPRSSAHFYWLDKILKDKTNIQINTAVCNDICNQVDELFSKSLAVKPVFEKRLLHAKFEKCNWPEQIQGFMQF